MTPSQIEEQELAESEESEKKNPYEDAEDEAVKKEEVRKKARLRRLGPYRKAHANW
jgi:hypothetical protein